MEDFPTPTGFRSKMFRAGEKSKRKRLYVYSQEFKLWNYSDGESAHYVKIRLVVRVARESACAIAEKSST